MNLRTAFAAEATSDSVSAPAAKIASAWGVVAITSWTDVASMLAALYTFILLCEWSWKRFLRPFAERRGWVKRLRRRKEDRDDD